MYAQVWPFCLRFTYKNPIYLLPNLERWLIKLVLQYKIMSYLTRKHMDSGLFFFFFFFFLKMDSLIKLESKYKASKASGGDSSNHTESSSRWQAKRPKEWAAELALRLTQLTDRPRSPTVKQRTSSYIYPSLDLLGRVHKIDFITKTLSPLMTNSMKPASTANSRTLRHANTSPKILKCAKNLLAERGISRWREEFHEFDAP